MSNYFAAILIYANNVQSGMGWKSANKSLFDCGAETDDRLTKCIEENSLSVNDISLTFSKGYSKTGQWDDELLPTNSYQSMDIRTHFANHISGMAHLVLSNTGAITEQIASTLHLHLNNTFSYFVVISDPKVLAPSVRPDSIPRIVMKIDEGTGWRYLFIKVSFG